MALALGLGLGLGLQSGDDAPSNKPQEGCMRFDTSKTRHARDTNTKKSRQRSWLKEFDCAANAEQKCPDG